MEHSYLDSIVKGSMLAVSIFDAIDALEKKVGKKIKTEIVAAPDAIAAKFGTTLMLSRWGRKARRIGFYQKELQAVANQSHKLLVYVMDANEFLLFDPSKILSAESTETKIMDKRILISFDAALGVKI